MFILYCDCVLVLKLNWIYLGVFFYYCCLNTIVSINSSSALNITMNKHYPEYYFDHHFFFTCRHACLDWETKIDRRGHEVIFEKVTGRYKSFFQLLHWSLVSECPSKHLLVSSNNRNTRKKCEICLVFTINTPVQRQWRRPGVFFFNFEHISHLSLLFLLLNLNRLMFATQKTLTYSKSTIEILKQDQKYFQN